MKTNFGILFLVLTLFLSASNSHSNEQFSHPLTRGWWVGLNPLVGVFEVPEVIGNDQLDYVEKKSFLLGCMAGLFCQIKLLQVSYNAAKRYTNPSKALGIALIPLAIVTALSFESLRQFVPGLQDVHGVINT
jgi:hypothetical protein